MERLTVQERQAMSNLDDPEIQEQLFNSLRLLWVFNHDHRPALDMDDPERRAAALAAFKRTWQDPAHRTEILHAWLMDEDWPA